MDWKFKKNAEPQGSSSGFWYDITSGGYIRPEELIEDAGQLEKLKAALRLVRDFELSMEKAELIIEF